MPSVSAIAKKAFVLVGMLSLAACENDVHQLEAMSRSAPAAETGRNIESYMSSGGRVAAKLVSPVMMRYQSDSLRTEFPKGLHVDFFDSLLHVETKLDARFGRFTEASRRVFLRDSVVVISAKGDTLRTSELWWDQYKQLFFTNKVARIYQPDHNFIFARYGLQATQDLQKFTFYQASGTLTVADSSLPQ